MKVMLSLMVLALLIGATLARAAGEETQVTVKTTEVKAVTTTESCTEPFSESKGPYYYQNTYELKSRKLVRGIANVVLCPAEIPNQMFREAYRSSPVSGAVVGIFKGFIKGGKRLMIGTWEIATFYHPGRNHYQPYIEPEVVFGEYLH